MVSQRLSIAGKIIELFGYMLANTADQIQIFGLCRDDDIHL
jgi:hypothetical protein